MSLHPNKPQIEEWLHWAEVVSERITECIRTYKRPPENAAFMPEADRQRKTAAATALLHRIHTLVDQAETPSSSIPDVHGHDEQIISGLAVTFQEVLYALPILSADMQTLMNSSWKSHFPNKIAQNLFLGESTHIQDGISSGYVEHGRLPLILSQILEREHMGDNRQPREELLKHGEPRRSDSNARQRWGEQNSAFLRTAGRVE